MSERGSGCKRVLFGSQFSGLLTSDLILGSDDSVRSDGLN